MWTQDPRVGAGTGLIVGSEGVGTYVGPHGAVCITPLQMWTGDCVGLYVAVVGAVGRAEVGREDGPGVVGAGSDDGAAVPNSSAPAQFVPEPVPAGAGPAALSVAVAAQAGASSPESAQQLSSIVVKSTSTLYNVPSLPAT